MFSIDGFLVCTVADDPAIEDTIEAILEEVWPRYLREGHWAGGDSPRTDWFGIYRRWPHYQFVLFDAESREPLAAGNALELAWDGAPETLPEHGWEWQMAAAAADHDAGRPAATLGALSISVRPAGRSRRLSPVMVRAMKALGQAAALPRLIAPVRPSWKARHPALPIEKYLTWTNDEGLAYDPWIRTHQRLGARIVRPCLRSMQTAGSVAEWETWTGLHFPTSGAYPVPDALSPVEIDLEADRGLYVEPNVWMVHTLNAEAGAVA